MSKDQIRNILNINFMIMAIVGVIWYLTKDKTVGTYIILFSMCFKIAESSMRMIK
jgi:hypothetical protein